MKTKSILYKTLTRALSIARPHNTTATAYFTQWLEDHVPKHLTDKVWRDVAGNLHVDARSLGTHKTLFVAHVDTVHKEVMPNKFIKTATHWRADGAPLGADDGAGCAMLMHMMHAGVPAYYVFTQGEEKGGIGASHLADNYPQLLSEFDRAIAFDRRGNDSIITDQAYGRCCSDSFAQHLSDELNLADDTFFYSPDPSGVYTDTAEFVTVIPECTNISVGYDREHSQEESLDVLHFHALSKAVLKVKWDQLPTEREPGVYEQESRYYAGFTNVYGTGAWQYDTDIEEEYKDMLFDALWDAQYGLTYDLLYMIGEYVYPEDPDMAVKHMDKRLLTDEVIDEARHMAKTVDVDTVLCTLFDQLHITH
jgi:hypothetical protein